MGAFMWNQWARFVSITASVYIIWAGIWGIFYRKFFWDFVGGVHMDTATQKGIIPGKNSAPFIAIIVTVPFVQIVALLVGMLNLTAFLGFLFYQGTNAGIWSTIAAVAYLRAQIRGELLEGARENVGKREAA
ncbi:hypothetical protein FRB97_009597 [Tulasnella sp. 331]|nr:hypothetical protein FRB97_009597 [Tulasnella sp. 331]